MIALQPGKGVGNLRYGDSRTVAASLSGDGQERDHPFVELDGGNPFQRSSARRLIQTES